MIIEMTHSDKVKALEVMKQNMAQAAAKEKMEKIRKYNAIAELVMLEKAGDYYTAEEILERVIAIVEFER